MALQSRTEIHINLDKSIEALTTDKVLKVGWPENTRYPEEQGGNYIAEIAAQNEYGAPHKHIPPRPFMGPAISGNRSKWMNIIAKGATQVLKGNTTILDVLDTVGAKAAFDVAKAIRAVTSPKLADITIENRKKRYLSKPKNRKKISLPLSLEKPLIDTGIMLRSITHVVESE